MTLDHKKNLIKTAIENGNYPNILYKYRTIEQAKKILDNFSLWFSTADSFNDPFDCSLSECLKPSLADARKHFERLGIKEAIIDRSIAILEREPDKLFKLIGEAKTKSILSKGVLSLSEKHDDILMWSHYSNYHKGIVLGLELVSDLDFFVTPIRVIYKDEYEELNYLNDPEKSTIDTLMIKSSQWAYENEIRIYKNIPGLHSINKKSIKEIYFGINTSQEDIDEVRKICATKGLSDVKFFKGEKHHGTFKIKFNLL